MRTMIVVLCSTLTWMLVPFSAAAMQSPTPPEDSEGNFWAALEKKDRSASLGAGPKPTINPGSRLLSGRGRSRRHHVEAAGVAPSIARGRPLGRSPRCRRCRRR
jgi:hypothetical protein